MPSIWVILTGWTNRDGLHLSGKAYDVLWKEYLKLVHGEFKGRDLDWQVIPGSTPGYAGMLFP